MGNCVCCRDHTLKSNSNEENPVDPFTPLQDDQPSRCPTATSEFTVAKLLSPFPESNTDPFLTSNFGSPLSDPLHNNPLLGSPANISQQCFLTPRGPTTPVLPVENCEGAWAESHLSAFEQDRMRCRPSDTLHGYVTTPCSTPRRRSEQYYGPQVDPWQEAAERRSVELQLQPDIELQWEEDPLHRWSRHEFERSYRNQEEWTTSPLNGATLAQNGQSNEVLEYYLQQIDAQYDLRVEKYGLFTSPSSPRRNNVSVGRRTKYLTIQSSPTLSRKSTELSRQMSPRTKIQRHLKRGSLIPDCISEGSSDTVASPSSGSIIRC